jgi:hypothetical protein
MYGRAGHTMGVERYLTALRAGGALIRDTMIILPRGASQSMRNDAEHVCAKSARHDWKFEEDGL